MTQRCRRCHASPAADATFFTVSSYIVFFRWTAQRETVCRVCALDRFRAVQYHCLTRGWWGLLFGPLANVIALVRNAKTWSRLSHLAPPSEGDLAEMTRPVRRRPAAYAATGVAAALVIATVLGTLGNDGPAAPREVAAATADTDSAPDGVADTGDDPTAPVTHHIPAHHRWGRLLMTPPKGWQHPHDRHLSIKAVSKTYQHPKSVRGYLHALSYRRGVEHVFYQSSPHVAVIEDAWQFRSADGADGWFKIWSAANMPHRGSVFRTQFRIPHLPSARGYLGRERDQFGFSYGLVVVRSGDVMLRIRYASLETVTKARLAAWGRRATRAAGMHPRSHPSAPVPAPLT